MATATAEKPSLETARRNYLEEIRRVQAMYGWSIARASAEVDRTRHDLLIAMWRAQGMTDQQAAAELSRRYGIPTRAQETAQDYKRRLKAEIARQRAQGLGLDAAFDAAVKIVGRYQPA